MNAPTLHCRSRHFHWDNSQPPALEVEPGAVIELEVMEASAGYCLCSVAVNLEISEIVDAPNWVVAARLPTNIFR